MTGALMLADAMAFDSSRSHAQIAAAAAMVLILFSFALALLLWRRLNAKWRWFGLGIALQIVVLIILWNVQKIYPKDYDFQFHPAALLGMMALAAVLVEGGRWIGFRFIMQEKGGNWANALMFALGYAAIAVIMNNLDRLQFMLAVAFCDPSKLTGDNLLYFQETLGAINRQPLWVLLETQYSQVWYILENMGLSVLVLTAWKRKQIVYLLLAVIVHALFDFWQDWIQARGYGSPGSILLLEIVATVYGLLALAVIFSLREKPAKTETLPLAPNP